jgi:hypothetical protein
MKKFRASKKEARVNYGVGNGGKMKDHVMMIMNK